MSFLGILGLLFLSLSWLWRIHLFTRPGGFWLPLTIVGLLLLSLSLRSVRLFESGDEGGREGASDEGSGAVMKFPRYTALLLVPLLLAVFTLPRPVTTGPLVLTVAVIAGMARGSWGRRFKPVLACLIGGTVLTIQGLVWPLIALVSAHVHAVPVFGYILYPFARLIDPDAAISAGRIFMSSVDEIYGLSVSLEKLAFVPMVLFFVAVVVSRIFNGDAVRSLGRLLLSFIIFGALRFLFLFLAVIILADGTLFWKPAATFLSLVPLPLLLAWLVPYKPVSAAASERGESREVPVRISAAAVLLFSIAFFLLAGSLLFHDPGSLKRGRVLFDERYSDWEWSTKAYDRNWYGQRSGYNYYCLAEYIGYFYELERGFEQFTPDYLARYDIVIVKTPTEPFSNEEIDALEAYVRRGGGLFLIGDHTNVFGTSTILNPVAARFGLRFNYDSTYDLATMALSRYKSPSLLAHPSTLHVPEFLYATSCTMDSPLFGENVMIGYGLRGILLDYSRTSYFPSKEEKEYEFPFLIQMAGVKAGRGRVLGFTDSTVFSNFFMFMPGKPELFIGSLDWLNRTNRWNRLNVVFLVAGLIAAFFACRAVGKTARFGILWSFTFGLVLGVVIALHFFGALKSKAYPPLEPVRGIKWVAFDQDPSFNEMPVTSLVRSKEASLHTFYVWTQRMGLVPTLRPTLVEALSSAPVAVVANPRRPLTIDEVDAVVDFCRGGGNLLLIVDSRRILPGTKEFLGIFRMNLTAAAADSTEIMNRKGERICRAYKPAALGGGVPLLTLPGGDVVLAYEKLGKGRFFAFSDFFLFSQAVMGPTSVVPSKEQREIFELEFQIFEILYGERDPDDIRPYEAPLKPGTSAQ